MVVSLKFGEGGKAKLEMCLKFSCLRQVHLAENCPEHAPPSGPRVVPIHLYKWAWILPSALSQAYGHPISGPNRCYMAPHGFFLWSNRHQTMTQALPPSSHQRSLRFFSQPMQAMKMAQSSPVAPQGGCSGVERVKAWTCHWLRGPYGRKKWNGTKIWVGSCRPTNVGHSSAKQPKTAFWGAGDHH